MHPVAQAKKFVFVWDAFRQSKYSRGKQPGSQNFPSKKQPRSQIFLEE
jgi:hypothetical protein